MGLSVIILCDFGISWSYSLAFCETTFNVFETVILQKKKYDRKCTAITVTATTQKGDFFQQSVVDIIFFIAMFPFS